MGKLVMRNGQRSAKTNKIKQFYFVHCKLIRFFHRFPLDSLGGHVGYITLRTGQALLVKLSYRHHHPAATDACPARYFKRRLIAQIRDIFYPEGWCGNCGRNPAKLGKLLSSSVAVVVMVLLTR